MKTGLVHIYTGNGKGKTTAAVGLCIRALGYGWKVGFVTFNKNPEKYGYKELEILRKLGTHVISLTDGHPHCDPAVECQKLKQDTLTGMHSVARLVASESLQMLVLDEVLISIRDGFLDEGELIQFIRNKPPRLELILTGRGCTENLAKLADYLSNVECVSHPFSRGITSREGIEC